MARQEYDLQLRRYDGQGWRAIIFQTGFEAGAALGAKPVESRYSVLRQTRYASSTNPTLRHVIGLLPTSHHDESAGNTTTTHNTRSSRAEGKLTTGSRATGPVRGFANA